MPRGTVTGGQRARRAGGDEAAEGEAGKRHRQLRRDSPRDRRQGGQRIDQMQEIVRLAPPFVVGTFAAADAAKIGTYGEPPERSECPGNGRGDLIVERAAVQRMRMPDVGDAPRRAVVGPVEGELDAPGPTGERQLVNARQHLDAKPFDNFALHEVRVDDLVDVVLIDVRVPDAFRIHHDTRPLVATVEAARLVDPDLAFTVQAHLLDPRLRMLLHFRCAMTAAAGSALFALVQAKEHVTLVVAH